MRLTKQKKGTDYSVHARKFLISRASVGVDRAVSPFFRPNLLASAAIVMLAVSGALHAAELRPETVEAWNEYIEAANVQAKARLDPGGKFFWFEEDAGRLARVQQGELLAAPVAGHGARKIPHGLIHHWIGAVFLPNTTLPEVFAVLRDYGRYKEIYRPVAVEAGPILREENSDKFSAVLSKKVLFVTATVYGEYESVYTQASQEKWSSVIYSTRLQDVVDYGKPTEHKLEPDDGSGFLWRVYGLSRYLERDGGVYVEVEGIVLTRNIPGIWRWLVGPIVDDLSRSTLLTWLRETRDAVLMPAGNAASKQP